LDWDDHVRATQHQHMIILRPSLLGYLQYITLYLILHFIILYYFKQ